MRARFKLGVLAIWDARLVRCGVQSYGRMLSLVKATYRGFPEFPDRSETKRALGLGESAPMRSLDDHTQPILAMHLDLDGSHGGRMRARPGPGSI
jgi:hypothetical protein